MLSGSSVAGRGGRSTAQRRGGRATNVKRPLNEEVFRTDEEKHLRWRPFARHLKLTLRQSFTLKPKMFLSVFPDPHLGSENKKELSSLSSLLVDVPQDDELTRTLEKGQKRLKALALKWLAPKYY